MKLVVLAQLAAALTLPPALEGMWDAASKGRHVADVHVHGDRADFDDGYGDGDSYQYQIQLHNGLLEMNGWVANANHEDAILWHKDHKEVMWRRHTEAKKLRGSNALAQSHSGLSSTQLPVSSSDDLAHLIAQSEAVRSHSAETVAKASGTADHFLPKANTTEHADKKDAAAPATVPEHSLVRQAEGAHTAHEARKVAVRQKVFAHALSQAVQDKYLTPLKAAQVKEQNSTVKGQHKRRKLFPAAMGSLASLMTNTQKGIDEDVFDEVIEMVRQIIRDEAASTTTDIETELNNLVAAITDCSTQHSYVSGTDGGTSGTYDGADGDYTTASQEYDTAYGEEQTTCTEKNTTCSNRDAKGQELYSEITGSSSCGLPDAPDDTVTYDDSFVLADVDTWANTLITKHTAWDTAKVECTTKEQECADKQTVTAEKETIKTEKCTALEGAASTGLSDYDNCYNLAAGAYSGYDYTATIDSVKNSIEAVETLMCYIDTAMEGLTGEKEDRETKADASTSCESDDATGQYICTCSDANGERYQEPYNLGLTVPDEPARDESWDALGCADAVVAK